MQPIEINNKIKQEHLLNFVISSLSVEFNMDLGEDINTTTEILYEALACASAGGTSINHGYKTTEDSPQTITVRGHLTEQFVLDTVEAVGVTLLQ